MSRGDDLRRLAAQLTALAELEDSVALGISRVLLGCGAWGLPSKVTCGRVTKTHAAISFSATFLVLTRDDLTT